MEMGVQDYLSDKFRCDHIHVLHFSQLSGEVGNSYTD